MAVCEQCRQIWLTSFVGAGRQVLVRRFGNAANRQLRQGFSRKARRQLKQHGQRRRSWGKTLTQDVQIIPHSHQANREIWGYHGAVAEDSSLLGRDTWHCDTWCCDMWCCGTWHCDMWCCDTWHCDAVTCDTVTCGPVTRAVTKGAQFLMFPRFVVPSSSRSCNNSWTIRPWSWRHYDPSTRQQPPAQWYSIAIITSQQPNLYSNSTVCLTHLLQFIWGT